MIQISPVQFIADVHPRLFLVLPLKFQSDRGVFGAENILLSCFARISLHGLDFPSLGCRQCSRPHLFKQRDGSNLSVVRCLLPAHR